MVHDIKDIKFILEKEYNITVEDLAKKIGKTVQNTHTYISGRAKSLHNELVEYVSTVTNNGIVAQDWYNRMMLQRKFEKQKHKIENN